MRRLFVVLLATGLMLVGWNGFSIPASDDVTSSAVGTRLAPETAQQVAPLRATPVDMIPDPTVPPRDPRPPRLLPPPEQLVEDLERHLQDPGLEGLEVSVSVWMEEHGTVFSHNPDLLLYPASNQKLLTGVGALGLLPSDFRFATEVALVGDNLVLVAGGDPTLTTSDLDRLAAGVVEAGITRVAGSLVVDVSRYDSTRMAPGWLDWQMPTYVGPLSVFVVGDNRHRTDADFLAEPDLGNADLLRAALSRAGVTVDGPTVLGLRPPEAVTLTALESAERDSLVARLLTSSDNEIAEALVREIGVVARGEGTTLSGLAAIEEYAASIGADLYGEAGDGSGLSRANLRSAHEWQDLLIAARGAEWWPTFWDSLAIAGRTGTLSSRLRGEPTAGNLRGKTGSIIGGRSLSGVLEDAAGRTVVFSLVANGKTAGAAVPVFDGFVATLAAAG